MLEEVRDRMKVAAWRVHQSGARGLKSMVYGTGTDTVLYSDTGKKEFFLYVHVLKVLFFLNVFWYSGSVDY